MPTSARNPNSCMYEVEYGRRYLTASCDRSQFLKLIPSQNDVSIFCWNTVLRKPSDVSSRACSSCEDDRLFDSVWTLMKKRFLIYSKISFGSGKLLWKPLFKPFKCFFIVCNTSALRSSYGLTTKSWRVGKKSNFPWLRHLLHNSILWLSAHFVMNV